jgi:hypothetical protein
MREALSQMVGVLGVSIAVVIFAVWVIALIQAALSVCRWLGLA